MYISVPRRQLKVVLWLLLGMTSCRRPEKTQPLLDSGRTVAPSAVVKAPNEVVEAPSAVGTVERSTTAMRTLFTITVTSDVEPQRARVAVEQAFAEIRRVEALMTSWDRSSPLAHVNDNAGIEPVTVPTELLDIVEESKRIGALSEGKFNIATQSLMDLWNHHRDPPRVPDGEEVSRRLRLLDLNDIKLDRTRNTLYLARKGMQIGLGGIAKGYGVDRAAQVLRSHQLRDFIVDGGGNLLVSGKKGSESWVVGIRNPRGNGHFAQFKATENVAVSTSGDYVKSFVVDGRRYHHLLDPSTGFPAQGVVSTTVIAATAELADAWSTAVFVLGVEKGMRLIEADPTLEAVVVDDQLRVHISSRFKPHVKLDPNVLDGEKLRSSGEKASTTTTDALEKAPLPQATHGTRHAP